MKCYIFLKESFILTLIVTLFITPPAAPSGHTTGDAYTEGETIPLILTFRYRALARFTIVWEIKEGTGGTSADPSDYSPTANSYTYDPDIEYPQDQESGEYYVHVADIHLTDDDIVEGPEIFCIHLTGVRDVDSHADPNNILFSGTKCITILDNDDDTTDPDPDPDPVTLEPDPGLPGSLGQSGGGGGGENWTSDQETQRIGGGGAYCLTGWKKTDGFGNFTPRVILHAVEVEIDTDDPSGIYNYKSVAIEIYADPTENLSNLDGWKLTVALLFNQGTDYYLTAENSTFNEDGIARIESPSENPFPMDNVQSSGEWLPGFDYRLFDENNVVVDFGISCYRHAGLQERLHAMEVPRVERDIIPPALNDEDLERISWRERLDWEDNYYLSIWLVPKVEPAEAPGAPAALRRPLTTSWATLKKQ